MVNALQKGRGKKKQGEKKETGSTRGRTPGFWSVARLSTKSKKRRGGWNERKELKYQGLGEQGVSDNLRRLSDTDPWAVVSGVWKRKGEVGTQEKAPKLVLDS